MEKGRVAICDQCGKELEVRWGIFAHQTLSRHMKEHNNGKKSAEEAA
jgi:hypothetical protein